MLESKSKSFTSDVLTLTTVPLISQIAGVLLTPIVTRLYTPEAFGIVHILGSFIMLFAVFTTMGYHGALILPKNDNTALNLLCLCLLSTIVISVITFIIMIISQEYFTEKLNVPELINFLWLTPIFVFSHGVYQTLRYWNTRLLKFNNIAISRIMEILCKKTYQIPAGIIGYATPSSLIIADLFSATVKNIVLFRNVGLLKLETIIKNINPSDLLAVAKRYRKFPMFSVWSELMGRMPAVIVAFMIVKYFGKDILGLYGLSLMVLSIPSTLITNSISEAFIPRASVAKHEGKHVELLEKIYVRMAAILIFPFMILGLFGNQLFIFVFGSSWMESGIMAQILVVRIFFEIIFSPSMSLTDIMEKQELSLIHNFASSLIVFIALLLGVYYKNIYVSLWTITILESISIIVLGSYMMRLINFPFLLTIFRFSKYLLMSIVLGAILMFINVFFNFYIIYFLLVITVATIIYYAMLLYFDRDFFQALRTVVVKK